MAAPNLLKNTGFNYFWKNLGKRTRWPCQGWEIYFCQHLPDHPGCPKSPRQKVTNPGLAYTSQSTGFNVVRGFPYLERPCKLQELPNTAALPDNSYILCRTGLSTLICSYLLLYNSIQRLMCFFITRALCTFSWICRILMHIYNLRFLTGPTLWYTTFPWKNCVLSPTRSL